MMLWCASDAEPSCSPSYLRHVLVVMCVLSTLQQKQGAAIVKEYSALRCVLFLPRVICISYRGS
jgi:hypothetical protein